MTEIQETVEDAVAEAAPAAPAAAPSDSFVLERPIQTVGRRKEAVVRVRLVPVPTCSSPAARSSRTRPGSATP